MSIHQVARIVETACAQSTNIFGYGIWTHHITQVVAYAKKLAPLFNADVEMVELAALLHDYASVKDAALYADHDVHGAIEAERILQQFAYPQPMIDAVKHCITAHRASTFVERRSPEAECLANADAVAHINNVPSLLYLAFVQQSQDIDEGRRWVRAKLERSYRKLDPRVQTLVRKRYDAAIATLAD
jgi:uncharacterized protein